MYSLPQLQALDYLLKNITSNDLYPLYQKNLKFVVNINNSLWCGDFVETKGNYVSQKFIDESGDVETVRFTPFGSNATTFLKLIQDSYVDDCRDQPQYFRSDPFKRINSLPLLFDSLIKILYKANISEETSPLFPYLLNAQSLDNKLSLPFINLEGEKIKLVSIIEIKN
ncbi:hypothetical protein [Brevibacillus sp. VP]|uniref:hypothetical protein n=1 Tax=unclassified Brevibacillus TaxID=2684853 RepID=UPI000E2EB3E7|nr:hypothetical protein [Brevibacillus sp. VP]RFB28327.1 hypothetical protein DZB91_23630 [Brevibacillus sp. VP]